MTEPTSFFMMALEFLLDNTENIKRAADIISAINAAKTIKGRYLGSRAPFNYNKEYRSDDWPGNRLLLTIVATHSLQLFQLY